MSSKMKQLIILSLLCVLSLWLAGSAMAVSDYTYANAFHSTGMATAPSATNGQGLAVNNRAGSTYNGYMYYCNHELTDNKGSDSIEIMKSDGTMVATTVVPNSNNRVIECAVDPVDDSVYVASLNDRKIFKMAPDGSSISAVITNTGYAADTDNTRGPRSLTVKGSGTNRTLYVAANSEVQIWISSDSGNSWTKQKSIRIWPNGTTAQAAVTVDGNGNIYTLDRSTNVQDKPRSIISKFDANGNYNPVRWDIPDMHDYASGAYMEDIKYVNNELGEFLLISAVNYGYVDSSGAHGAYNRVFRYRMDGSIADSFGYNISSDANLKNLRCDNKQGNAYMDVCGDSVFIEGEIVGSTTSQPEIIQVQMPALPSGALTPVSAAKGPYISKVTDVSKYTGADNGARWICPTTSTDIAFLSERNQYIAPGNMSGMEFLKTDADGNNPTALTDGTVSMTNCTISPDGKYIIYRKNNSAISRNNLYLRDTTTGQDTLFTGGTTTLGHNDWPVWVPNSGSDPANATVYFTSGRDGQFEIWKLVGPESDTNKATCLTSTVWKPDYTTNSSGSRVLWDVQGLATNPDGSKIVFSGKPVSTNAWDVCLLDVASGKLSILTDNYKKYQGGAFVAEQGLRASFTKDGSRIIFNARSSDDYTDHLYVMDLDGSNVHMISGTPTKYGALNREYAPVSNFFADKMACVAINADQDTFAADTTAPEEVYVYDLTNSTTTGSVSGTVLGDGDKPLAGVCVYNTNTGATATTDANGQYSFSTVDPGGYVFKMVKNGYLPIYRNILVTPGNASTDTAKLLALDAPIPGGPSAIIEDKGDGTKQVSIRWKNSTSPFAVGYNIYSSSSEDGPWTKLNANLITENPSNPQPIEYLDTPADILSAYYKITSVSNSPEFGMLESPSAFVVQAANNLIFNGSFEIAKNAVPVGWENSNVSSKSGYMSQDTFKSVSGNASLKIAVATSTRDNIVQSDYCHFPAEGGQQYAFSFYGMTDGSATDSVKSTYSYLPEGGTGEHMTDTYDPTTTLSAGTWNYGTEYVVGGKANAWVNSGFNYNSPSNAVALYEPLTMPQDALFTRALVRNTGSSSVVAKNIWFDEIRFAKTRIGSTGSVFGRIVDGSGNGVGGATVAITGMNSVTSASDGYYYFRNVPTGNVSIKVTSSDGTLTTTQSALNAGGVCVPITLAAAPGTITGAVTFSGGGAVSGAKVTTDSGFSAVTGSDGKYTINSVPVGNTKIRAWVSGYKPSTVQTVTVATGASVTANFTISNSNTSDTVTSFNIKWVSGTAPVINGKVDTTTEWNTSDTISPFYINGGTTKAQLGTTVRALYDTNNLYVSYVCSEDDLSGISTTATGRDSADMTKNDSVALYVDPLNQKNGFDGTKLTYMMACNSQADATKIGYTDLSLDGSGTADTGWIAPGFSCAASQDTTNNLWYAEMSVPFSSLPGYTGTPTPGMVSGMLFARYRNDNDHFLSANGDGYTSTAYTTDDMTKTTFLYNAAEWNNVIFGDRPLPGDITGTVTFSKDSSPVAGAVVITNNGLTATTDATGSYVIKNAPAGAMSLMASVIGWKPSAVKSVTVSGNTTANITITNDDPIVNGTPVLTIYSTSTVPTIDGKLDATSEWGDAASFTNFYHDTEPTPGDIATKVYVKYDINNLYVAFDCTDPDLTKLVPTATTGRDQATWAGDDVEVYVDPLHHHGGPSTTEAAYQIDADPTESPNTAWFDQVGQDMSWSPAGNAAASHQGTGHWYSEFKIAFAGFTGVTGAPAANSIIGGLFGRHYPRATDEWISTGYTAPSGNWTDPTLWDDIVLGGAKVVTQNFATTGGFVQPGKWNLISLPGVPSNADPTSVFAGIDVANASFQYWDNQAATPGFVGYGLGWTGPATCAVPYWMVEPKATTAKDISFPGVANTTDQVISIPTHASAPYWIAIGLPFNSANYALSNVQFSSNGGAYMSWTAAYNANPRIVDSSMQGYNAATGTFDRVNGLGTDTIQPWWGYWMLVFDGNKLDIKFPAPTK